MSEESAKIIEERIINFNYLKKLNKPEEAITNDLWKNICDDIIQKSKINNNFEYIINQRINKVAPYFGVLWTNLKDDPCISYMENDFNVIYNMKYTRDWFKSALVLTIFGLEELINNDERIEVLYKKIYKPSNKELKEIESEPFYRNIRITVNNFFTKEKDNITNENYDETYKNFIKMFIKLLMSNGNFNTEDIKKYINVAYQRLVNNKNYTVIAEELDTQPGIVSNIINKFINEFKKAYKTEEELAYLCRKFENFYDKVFTVLDDSNYNIRNQRLETIKLFQKTFITEELGLYIN